MHRKVTGAPTVCAALALAATLLAGCTVPANAPAYDETEIIGTTTETTTAEAAVDGGKGSVPVGTLRVLPLSPGAAYNAGDALYELATDSEETGNAEDVARFYKLLLKTDYATGMQSCVCQKPDCTHDSEACPAYVSDEQLVQLIMEDGNAYICYVGYTSYDGLLDTEAAATPDEALSGKTSRIELLRAGAESREQVVELPMGVNPMFYWRDENALYGVCSKPGQPEAILRCDLKTGQLDTRSLLANEEVLGVYGNRFVTWRRISDQDLNSLAEAGNAEAYQAAMQNSGAEYALWDFSADTRQKLFEETRGTDFREMQGHCLYRFEEGANGKYNQLVLYDLTTGEQRTVNVDLPEENFTIYNGFMPLDSYTGGEYLWVCGDSEGAGFCGISLSSGAFHSIARKFLNAETGYCIPVAETNDGRWLIRTGNYKNYDRSDYGLVTPEEYFSEGNYTSVTLYES